MRNLKKVLALVVAFSMMLSVVAFAGYKDVPADAEYAGALDLLSALEIIKGDDLGNFNPDATITRAEMAAIVCRAKGLESAANGAKGATIFTDVAADHWASGYINLANQNNIINGYGDGRFGPEDTVTYEQVIKMLVCALGFEPMAAAKGGWATGYLVVANTYKITEGAAADATRKNVATLVYNALSTPMMDQTSFGADAEYQILDGRNKRDYKSLLTDMDIYVATGVIDAYDAETVTVTLTEASEDLEFEAGEKTFEKGNVDVTPYMYQAADIYVKKNSRKDYEVVAIVASVMGETLAILSDDIVDGEDIDDGEFEYYIDAANSSKTKKVKVEKKADIEYNRGAESKTFAELVKEDDVELILIENTSDNKFDKIIATKYTSKLVDYVDADKDKIEIDGKTITFDFEDEDVEIILVDDKGAELTLADFAEDDVVAVVADNTNFKKFTNYIKIIKLSNAAVTGVIDEAFESNGYDYIVINGEEYMLSNDESLGLGVGDEGTFYIGMTGKVIYFDGSVTGKDYAYILEAAKSKSSFSADKWQVKLLTEEDGIVTYDVTVDANDAFNKYFTDTAKAAFKANSDGDYLYVDNTSNLDNAARLITYKTNAKGQIRSFDPADGAAKAIDVSKDDYNDRTQVIAGCALEDDIAIFNLTGSEAEDAYATDISYLVDESKYGGFAFADNDGEYVIMVITNGESIFSLEAGFAVATKIARSKDADDNDIVKVSYVQDEVEGVITFDDEADMKGELDYEDLTVGSVFLFNADANGVVSSYVVVGTVSGGKLTLNDKGVAEAKKGSDPVEIVEGFIENTERKTTSKGENITVKGSVINVAKDANKYTYNNAGRNVAIETEDFMAHDDMDYAEVDVDYITEGTGDAIKYYEQTTTIKAAKVLIRIVDGVVVDIYGFAATEKVVDKKEITKDAYEKATK